MVRWREPNPIKWAAVVDVVKLESRRSIDEIFKDRMAQKEPVELAYNGWPIVTRNYTIPAGRRVVVMKRQSVHSG